MKNPLSSRSTTKKMSLDGTVYVVRIVEISTKEITIGRNGELEWPRIGTDATSPKVIDGVLVLHDVTQPASLSELTDLLGMFHGVLPLASDPYSFRKSIWLLMARLLRHFIRVILAVLFNCE